MNKACLTAAKLPSIGKNRAKWRPSAFFISKASSKNYVLPAIVQKINFCVCAFRGTVKVNLALDYFLQIGGHHVRMATASLKIGAMF